MPDMLNTAFLNGKTIGSELKKEFITTSASLFSTRLAHYKTYINSMDENIEGSYKSIEKLKDTFKSIQMNSNQFKTNQEEVFETVKKLSDNMNDVDIKQFVDKFADISTVLNNNLTNFVNNLTNKSISCLEQLIKATDNDKTLNHLKKSVDKSLKTYESKCKDKMKQSNSKLDRVGLDDIQDEVYFDEKCSAARKLCEYLVSANSVRTKTCNEITNCLINYFKSLSEYFNQSMQIITNYSNYFTKLQQYMIGFNRSQELERDILIDAIDSVTKSYSNQAKKTKTDSFRRANRHRTTSHTTNHHSSTPSLSSSDSLRKPNNVNNVTTNDVYNIHQLETNKSYGTTTEGFLLKHASRSRMRKQWMKRKCVVENGLFYIFHSDLMKEPIVLKLITCQTKIIDKQRFKVFSGSNSRIYDFMTESEDELDKWISVLNNSKNESLSKALSNNKTDDSVLELNNNILSTIKRLDGNNKCCDCSMSEPEWLIINLGILVCIECCGIHRELGVHISKTQSIIIDKLKAPQLIIARMTGNSKLNRVFEATLDSTQKLLPTCNMETRRRYIKQKYEMHKFAKANDSSVSALTKIVDLINKSDSKYLYQALLEIFAQNVDIMSPIEIDERKRNILQLVLLMIDSIDDSNHLHIVDFITKNRDFTKTYTLDYQDMLGNTALHYCALKNHVEAMKILLKANIDYGLKNKDGQTAYDLAYRLMNFDCAKLIKQLINTKNIDDVEWIGCFDEDYLSDTCDDNNVVSMRSVRPSSMISFDNFISPSVDKQINSPGLDNQNKAQQTNVQYLKAEVSKQSSNNIKHYTKAFESRLNDAARKTRSFIETTDRDSNSSPILINMTQKGAVNKRSPSNDPTDGTDHTRKLDKPNQPMFKCKAIKTYQTTQQDHLSFIQDDVIVVFNRKSRNLWEGFVEKNPDIRGIFPTNYVNIYV